MNKNNHRIKTMKDQQEIKFTTNNIDSDEDKIIKITSSSNYYDLNINDREEFTDLLLEWVTKEKKTLHNIKNR